MDKKNLLNQVKKALDDNVISKKDLDNLFEDNNTQEGLKQRNLNDLLYTFGGVIIIIGLSSLTWQLWPTLNSVNRILITLGLGILLTFIAAFNSGIEKSTKLVNTFYILGALLIPGGVIVFLNELGFLENQNSNIIFYSFALVSIFYLAISLIKKDFVATFFTIAHATYSVYLFTDVILSIKIDDFYQYLSITIGISYFLLGKFFESNWNKKLSPALYVFGSIFTLGPVSILMFEYKIYELILFFVIAAIYYLSVYLTEKSILTIATFFLFFHLIYITNEYFADSVGWPLSMIILGFIFIGLGYASYNIDKKYIGEKK